MPFSIRPHRRLPLAYLLGLGSLITLLLLSSGPADAEWMAVGGKVEGGMTAYADPGTIRREGGLVKMWHLYDYKTVQAKAGASFLSMNAQYQYDCAEERTRLLAFTWFSGNMENGNVVVNNSDEGKWEPVSPGSINEALWEVACGKK